MDDEANVASNLGSAAHFRVCSRVVFIDADHRVSIPIERLSEMELLLPAPGTALRAEIDSATGPAALCCDPPWSSTACA